MADIDVQRRSGMTWLWLALGLLVLILLAWLLVAAGANGPDEAIGVSEPLLTPEMMPDPLPTPALTVSGILATPAPYVGSEYGDEVRVAEIATDRGFWIQGEGGARLFTIVIDRPADVPLELTPGQTIEVGRGTLRDRFYFAEPPGTMIDPETRAIAESQPIFLVVEEADLAVIGSLPTGADPMATPAGATPAAAPAGAAPAPAPAGTGTTTAPAGAAPAGTGATTAPATDTAAARTPGGA